MNTEIIELDNGKYTLYKTDLGTMTAHRYGEPWRELTGDNLVYILFDRIKDLEDELNKIHKKDDILYKLARIVRGTDCIHPTNRGRMIGDLLSELRIIDNSRYDKEVIANPKIIAGE